MKWENDDAIQGLPEHITVEDDEYTLPDMPVSWDYTRKDWYIGDYRFVKTFNPREAIKAFSDNGTVITATLNYELIVYTWRFFEHENDEKPFDARSFTVDDCVGNRGYKYRYRLSDAWLGAPSKFYKEGYQTTFRVIKGNSATITFEYFSNDRSDVAVQFANLWEIQNIDFVIDHIPVEVDYRVDYYLQDAESGEYVKSTSVTKQGLTDSKIDVLSLGNTTKEYSSIEAKGATVIAGTGDSVVELYYTRPVYTITLRQYLDDKEETIQDTSYDVLVQSSDGSTNYIDRPLKTAKLRYGQKYKVIFQQNKQGSFDVSEFSPSVDTVNTITSDITVYAKIKHNYSVTITNDTLNTSKVISGANQTVSLPSSTKKGYSFLGYQQKSTGKIVPSGNSPIISQDDSFTAQYQVINYSIGYNLNGGSISGQRTSYNITNYNYTPPNPSRRGYRFSGWSTNYASGDSQVGNRTYTANWRKLCPTKAYIVCEKKNYASRSQTVNAGETFTVSKWTLHANVPVTDFKFNDNGAVLSANNKSTNQINVTMTVTYEDGHTASASTGWISKSSKPSFTLTVNY